MKKSIYLAAAIVLAAVSCQRDELVPEYNFSIKATREAGMDTKSTVSDAGAFSWVSGDAIGIYNGSSFNKLTTTESGASATFTGTVVGTPQTCAVFPYTIADTPESVTLPASYEWVADQANAPMYADYNASGLAFKHLGGLIKVTVAGVPATATSFVFTADKDITGTYTINKDGENGEIKSQSAATGKTVTFTFAAAESAREMSFYVPVPVGSYKMAVALKNGETELWSFAGSTSNEITRAKLLIMPKLTITSIPGSGEGTDPEKTMVYAEGPTDLAYAFENGYNVTLNDDITTDRVTLPAGKSSVLYLNGKTIRDEAENGMAIIVNGDLTIEGEGSINSTYISVIATGENSSLTIKGGNYTAPNTIVAQNGAKAVIDGGTYSDGGIYNGDHFNVKVYAAEAQIKSGSFAGTYNVRIYNGGKTIIDGGTYQSVEGCATVFGVGKSDKKSELTINNGTFTATDNAVIGGNGTNKADGTCYGDTKMVVNGGTFNGKIKTSGYIACGIYHPQRGELVVNGGTFNIENGCGIVMRGGKLNLGAGATFNYSGSELKEGWVGDKKTKLPVANDVIAEKSSGYYDANNVELTIASAKTTIVYVDSQTELVDAVNNGYNIILAADITIDYPLVINKDVTIDLNGKKITAKTFSEDPVNNPQNDTESYVFWVKEGTLTVNGEGEVIATNNNNLEVATYSMAVWVNGGNAILNGGTYRNGGDNCDLIYASKSGSVTINGGTYIATENYGAAGTADEHTALNCNDNSYKNNKVSITVKGGSFYKFDPSNCKSEGDGTNFVAEGYKSTQSGDYYIVSAQ